MKVTIVVTIGRNIGDKPMLPAMWRQFKEDVVYVLETFGANIIQAPRIDSDADAVGSWEGAPCEEAAAFVAFIDTARVHCPVPHLRNLANKYTQDAIGWIVADGTNNLIHARQPGQYGDVTDSGHVVGV